MNDQRAHHDVELVVGKADRYGVADAEIEIGKALVREVDLRLRWVDADERGRRAAARDQLAEGAGAAAGVQPARIPRRRQPVDELLADGAAPAPHEALVLVRGVEADLGFGHGRPHGRIANARAGKPRPFLTFGHVTTISAPFAGTLSRFAITSI